MGHGKTLVSIDANENSFSGSGEWLEVKAHRGTLSFRDGDDGWNELVLKTDTLTGELTYVSDSGRVDPIASMTCEIQARPLY